MFQKFQKFAISIVSHAGRLFLNNLNEMFKFSSIFQKKNLDQHSFRREEPDDLADEIEHINRAVEHCERRNQHEVYFRAL